MKTKRYIEFLKESNKVDNSELIAQLNDFLYDLKDDMFVVKVSEISMPYHVPRFVIKVSSEYSLAYNKDIGFEKYSQCSQKNKDMFDISIETAKRIESTKNWKIDAIVPTYGGPSGTIHSNINIYCHYF